MLLDNQQCQLAKINIMSQSTIKATYPSFLAKLQDILNNEQYSHIIRWDKSGKHICIHSIQCLEDDVLPNYFRHSKFASFVRQLNIYGFHKKKSDKSSNQNFFNEYFSKGSINLSALIKHTKKGMKHFSNKEVMSHASKEAQSEQTYHQTISQLEDFPPNHSTHIQQANATSGVNSKIPVKQVNQLIQQFTNKAQPFISQIDWEGYLQLQTLCQDPKYQQINQIILSTLLASDWISPFINVHKGGLITTRMQFIL